MKRISTIAFFLIVSIGLTLPPPAAILGGQKNKNDRPATPPPQQPRPPGISDSPADSQPPSGTLLCPGFKDCTAWLNSAPPQVHVEFPGPHGMTLHGHLYVPGVSTLAQLDALSKTPSSGGIIDDPQVQATTGLPPLKKEKVFPVVIYNHGSEEYPTGAPSLAKLYVEQGYIFFAPDRHGQGLSKDAGPYIVDLQQSAGSPQASGELHELYNLDVIAALDWLKRQPYVNTNRLVMTGISYGGIQTLLTAEKDPGIRAYLPFTPGAESWGNQWLRQRLITAVQNEKAPMFLIQAKGDYSLGPTTSMGPLLAAKGDAARWKSKLYDKFGCTNQDAHGRFSSKCDGIAIWSADVLKFIDHNLSYKSAG